VMASRRQRLTYDKDVQAFGDEHKHRVESMIIADFPRKIRVFDDLLQTEPFSVTKLGSLLEETRAVSLTYTMVDTD